MDIVQSGGRILYVIGSHGMYVIIHGDGEIPISWYER